MRQCNKLYVIKKGDDNPFVPNAAPMGDFTKRQINWFRYLAFYGCDAPYTCEFANLCVNTYCVLCKVEDCIEY